MRPNGKRDEAKRRLARGMLPRITKMSEEFHNARLEYHNNGNVTTDNARLVGTKCIFRKRVEVRKNAFKLFLAFFSVKKRFSACY